jgi:LuxR family maltose regulon positive regulatory protein
MRRKLVQTTLSPMELRLLRQLSHGPTNRELAEFFSITVGTTKWRLYQMFQKLGVRNRTAAVARAREMGII